MDYTKAVEIYKDIQSRMHTLILRMSVQGFIP